MAAPLKKGIDYFAHDCNLDHKIDIVEARFGLIGYGVYFKLLEVIYAQGDALNVNEDFWLVFFAKKCQIDYDKGMEIVEFLVKKNLFDSQEFENGVLTNSGIKKRFKEATKRRKHLSVDTDAQSEINVSNNDINVNINQVNADINPQSKVKESKVNSIYLSTGENENFEEKTQPVGIKISEYTSESLAYQLRQKTPQKFGVFQKKHGGDWEVVLKNYIDYHENAVKPNFEEIAKHLLNYNFIGEQKEKNFATKKETQNFRTNGNNKFGNKDERRTQRLTNLASKHNIDIG